MKRILLITILLCSLKTVKSQNYTFQQLNLPYNTVSGGTVISTAGWDYFDTFIVPFPFQFNYYGSDFDTFYVEGGFGGFEYYGSGIFGNYYMYFYDAPVMDQGFGLSPISYSVIGNAPNRILILQIENGGFMYDQTLSDYFEVQVWFHETTNVLEFHYGPSSVLSSDSWYVGYDGPTVAIAKDTSTFLQLYGPADNVTATTTFVTDFVTGSPSVTEVYRFTPGTTGVKEAEKFPVSLFPNPSNGIFNIQTTNLSGTSQMSIFDFSGRLVVSESLESSVSQFDLKLPSGVYLVRISHEEKVFCTRLVVTEYTIQK